MQFDFPLNSRHRTIFLHSILTVPRPPTAARRLSSPPSSPPLFRPSQVIGRIRMLAIAVAAAQRGRRRPTHATRHRRRSRLSRAVSGYLNNRRISKSIAATHMGSHGRYLIWLICLIAIVGETNKQFCSLLLVLKKVRNLHFWRSKCEFC
eukprot:TRINITY_DN4871_c0_g1_i2.p1 TRINITY_DN4871_c0_g1~~TRINITY_DN4871_c0_g1_i2.p1  ORF type:complete len:150 (+),score=2.01 TRINITY_DN4871_c0_g1_i2:190-639(+)